MVVLYTDTSANLPLSMIQQHHIRVLPFAYTVNGVEAENQAETEFDGKSFYDAMRNGADVKTSMVNMELFTEAFRAGLEAGNDVLYVGMSGGISGTANAAAIAAKTLQSAFPARKIYTIDTFAASLGEGLFVMQAAEMLESGVSIDAVAEYILDRRNRMCQYFTVDDLDYLKRGGRISGAAAFVGSILQIKPILTGNEIGQIVLHEKVRGKKQAIAALANKFGMLAADKSERIGIAHADNPEGAEMLLAALREKGFCGTCITVLYEPVTGSHVGPGTIALFYLGTHK